MSKNMTPLTRKKFDKVIEFLRKASDIKEPLKDKEPYKLCINCRGSFAMLITIVLTGMTGLMSCGRKLVRIMKKTICSEGEKGEEGKVFLFFFMWFFTTWCYASSFV